MKRIEAIIRPEQLEDVKENLQKLNVNGISITQIMGTGCQRGYKEYVRGMEVDFHFLKKIKLELIVADEQLEPVIANIIETAQTGNYGDGKIFVSEVVEAIRIRTGERGGDALK